MRMRTLDPLRAVAFVLILAGMTIVHLTIGWWAFPLPIPDRVQRWIGWRP